MPESSPLPWRQPLPIQAGENSFTRKPRTRAVAEHFICLGARTICMMQQPYLYSFARPHLHCHMFSTLSTPPVAINLWLELNPIAVTKCECAFSVVFVLRPLLRSHTRTLLSTLFLLSLPSLAAKRSSSTCGAATGCSWTTSTACSWPPLMRWASPRTPAS